MKIHNIIEGKSENRELWDKIKSKGVVPGFDREKYTDLSDEGLEGPFRMKNGQVLYYDPKEGKYYNRDTDMYVDYDDYRAMNEGVAEGSERVDTLVTKGLKLMRGPTWLDAVAAIKYQVGERDYRERKQFYDFFVKQLVDRYGKKGMAENMQSLPAVNENEYWCQIDSAAKPIPEGYKKLASGYITKVS